MKNKLFLISILFLVACSKKNEKLIVGLWKFEKIEISIDGGQYTEEPLGCRIDDIWNYKKNGEFEINPGIECAGEQPLKTTWYLKDDQKTIVFIHEGISGEYYTDILELTKDKLITEHDLGTLTPQKYKFYFNKY